ncbi:unnamed protein product [Parnassius apollo]|uniref:(apollo) hypothetical protein n=1 Tax=Parnassius apollo TaxID=110799 RepID=A0A8S3XMU1_PARAO|nr:unnamed protein product [Parnassius apollo]
MVLQELVLYRRRSQKSPVLRMAPQSPQPQVDERLICPPPETSAGSEPSQPMVLEEQLDGDILILLGASPKNETPMGPAIHKDIANRWQDILAKGLVKDVKESLLKTYLIPSNCDLIAPALNSGVKAALTETSIKRDSSLLFKQKQLGVAIAALCAVANMIISDETGK